MRASRKAALLLALASAMALPDRMSHAAGRIGAASGGHAHLKATGAKVAVQPFEGPNSGPLRALVVRIVHGRGFHPVTALPHYEGTGQYPSLAREHRLAAFVTADVEERGRWQRITFLIWNGLTGSVLGRWTASAPTPILAQAVGKGFWQHLGPAILKAEAPVAPTLDRAPLMRIDASDSVDEEPVAEREHRRAR